MNLSCNSIDLVIFDCDGVLIDSEVISAQVIVDMLAVEGVLIDVAYVYNYFLGRPFSSVAQILKQDHSFELSDCFESNYREELLLAYKKELCLTVGVKEILSNLAVPSCVVTSSSRLRTQAALELVGLTDYFGNNIFTSSDVKHSKPAPDLFLLAAKKMQVNPNRCLVIEDSVTGITAATAARMRVWRYTGGRHFVSTNTQIIDQFPEVYVFDSWKGFFEVAPGLKKTNTVFGDQHDN